MDANKRIWVLLAVSAVALGVPYLIKPHPGDKPGEHAAAGKHDGDEGKAAAPANAAPAAPVVPTTPARQLSASELAARAASQVIGRIETDSYVASVSNLNGGLKGFALKGKHFEVRGKPLDLVTTDKEQYLPLAIDLAGWPAAGSSYQLTSRSSHELLLALEQDGLRVTRK